MADIAFAFNKITTNDTKPCNIEHFFTQRKVDEVQEFISEKIMFKSKECNILLSSSKAF